MPRRSRRISFILVSMFMLAGCSGSGHGRLSPGDDPANEPKTRETAEGFVSIFNGKDLAGWTPKFAGEDLGHNYKDTFVVEDGVLRVGYDNYDTFNGKFGHLFFDKPYSHYILRLDYRFLDGHCKGAPGYTWINSGVMLHSQSAASMSFKQQFPSSIEAQMLGLPAGDQRKRTTANVCTPGTHIFFEGKLDRRHCIGSSSDSFYIGRWVALEMEVRGHEKMVFRINGEEVFKLQKPQLDPGDKRDDYAAKKLIEARGGESRLSEGYIALQAEGAPLEFRNIRIKELRP